MLSYSLDHMTEEAYRSTRWPSQAQLHLPLAAQIRVISCHSAIAHIERSPSQGCFGEMTANQACLKREACFDKVQRRIHRRSSLLF